MLVTIGFLTREKQITLKSWYNKPWEMVLRPTNENFGELIASNIQNYYDKHLSFSDDYELIQNAINFSQKLNKNNFLKVLKSSSKFNFLKLDKYTKKNDLLEIGDILLSDDNIAVVVEIKEIFESKQQYNSFGSLKTLKRNIPVYNGPGQKYQKIGIISRKNTELQIISILNNGWYQIIFDSLSGYGYIYNDNHNLEIIKTIFEIKLDNKKPSTVNYLVKIIADKTAIKTNLSEKSSIIGYLEKNKQIKIIKENSGWGLIQSGLGWISLEDVERI